MASDRTYVIEAAGEPESFQQAMELVRRGGTVIYCGIYPFGAMPMDFNSARRKELQILFVRRSVPKNYSEAIRLVDSGQIVPCLLSRRRPIHLTETPKAFREAEERIPGLVKAILLPSA